MIDRNFAAFIITNRRATKQKTYRSLISAGYSGRVFFIVDDEDPELSDYIRIYGDSVLIFNKLDASKLFDEMDNFEDRRSSAYGRNMCFEYAKRLGLTHFLILDDDYTSFRYRYPHNGMLKSKEIHKIDEIINAMNDFLDESGAISVCFAQAGDFIGGLNARTGGAYRKKVHRKAMNCFFCKTDRKFEFPGRINEDVNAYTYYGSRGYLMLTITDIAITQPATQSAKGGMTDLYQQNGTYVKSFYSVIGFPSGVRVENMGGNTKGRIHHRIDKQFTYPLILNSKWKKGTERKNPQYQN